MTLSELSNSLKVIKGLPDLAEFIGKSRFAISLTLLNADVSNPDGLRQLDEAFSAFSRSEAGKIWEKTQEYSFGISILLPLFALAYERSSAYGKIKLITSYLPNSSLKKRLQSLSIIYNDIGFRAQDYARSFPRILNLLSEAQYEHDESASDNTGYVLRILKIFQSKGETDLKNRAELANFKSLFNSAEAQIRWPILKEYLEANNTALQSLNPLQFQDTPREPLAPTDVAEEIFQKHITQPLRQDERTPNLGRPLGLDFIYIVENVINHGTSNFCEAHEKASIDDKVLLYCHCNMRKHFFTTRYVFDQFFDFIKNLIDSSQEKLIFIDIGCGPLTSGLAIADLYLERAKHEVSMRYIGVDIAQAMLDKAGAFSKSKALFGSSEFSFHLTWQTAFEEAERLVNISTPIIINASYLFASSSLNVQELAAAVSQLRRNCVNAPIYFVFQNPNKVYRNVKYVEWKKHLPPFSVVRTKVATVEYFTSQTAQNAKPEAVYYEILSFQGF